MKKFIICLGISAFAAGTSLQAEDAAKAPAPKASPIAKDKAAAACDSDCDAKPDVKSKWTLTKPVLMSPKAAAAAGCPIWPIRS
jgi:hypothetical protein